MATTYHFRTDWKFRAPVQAVWSAVLDIEQYPRWWKDFRRVRMLKGDGSSVGSVFACEVRGSLPYSLNYVMEVLASEPYRRIELRSEGDLVGTGRWEFESASAETLATYYWDVATTNPILNLLAPLARDLFARNHEQVMARGYAALRPVAEGQAARG